MRITKPLRQVDVTNSSGVGIREPARGEEPERSLVSIGLLVASIIIAAFATWEGKEAWEGELVEGDEAPQSGAMS